ncbi:MAG: glycosyltransferase [Calditrichaeota bacterium]|nr:MAG: glycosyltransferase [Calditrichota bacterium]
MNQNCNALVVYAKYPEPGKVKTRLAATIGEILAAEVYSRFIHHIFKKHQRADKKYDFLCAVAPANKLDSFKNTFSGPRTFIPQISKSDLGKRLFDTTQKVQNLGYNKIVIIGTDSPALPMQHIEQAFVALDKGDLALGPTSDGGYYLIGMREPNQQIFESIRWSTEFTLKDTMKAANRTRLKYSLLPEHFDIDEGQDLHYLLQIDNEGIFPENLKSKIYAALQEKI